MEVFLQDLTTSLLCFSGASGPVTAETFGGKVRLYVGDQVVESIPARKSIPQVLRSGNLVIDSDRRTVDIASKRVNLSPMQFDILVMFLKSSGEVFAKQDILDTIWPGGYVSKHVFNTHLYNLRRKLENAGWDGEISTVRARGFRLGD